MKFSNRIYDILKDIAQLWIPALSALYAALANVWGLPYSAEVVGTLAAVDAFLGAILKISNAQYMSDNGESGI